MPNRGTLPGVVPEQTWRRFTPTEPILVYTAASGTPTQPILGSSTVVAQYRYERALGRVSYLGYIQFDSSATFGSGDDVWNVLLPRPAAREFGLPTIPIGLGYVWQGSAGNRNMTLRAVQSDPKFPIGTAAGTSSDEDHYMQFFVEHNVASGTGAFASSGTTVTVNHGLNYTPAASDIQIVWTNNPSTSQAMWWITSPTSTQFTVNIKTSATTTPATFSWKVSGEPNGTVASDALVNQKRPLGQWASGWVLGWNVEYEARR